MKPEICCMHDWFLTSSIATLWCWSVLPSANIRMDISAHLLSFFKELQRDKGGGRSQRGETIPSSACELLLGSAAIVAHMWTGAMLKFFSARDDETESLLGAIPEGKRYGEVGGVHDFSYIASSMMLRECLPQKKRWYSIYQRCIPTGDIYWTEGSENHLSEVCPVGEAGCEVTVALPLVSIGSCERIKHLHVWWRMRHCPAKRALQSAASVKPHRLLFGDCSQQQKRQTAFLSLWFRDGMLD